LFLQPSSSCGLPKGDLLGTFAMMVGTLTGLLIYFAYVWWKVVSIMRQRNWSPKLVVTYHRLMMKRIITLSMFSYAPMVETICNVFSCRRIGWEVGQMWYCREDVPVSCENARYSVYKKVCTHAAPSSSIPR